MGKLEYLKVKNITEQSADVYFYGEIVGDEWEKWNEADTCPDDVIKALKETEGKDLNIYINSPGGNVFAGLAIYNMLKRKKEKKTCYVDGLAASIASVICMAGDEIVMPKNTFLMVHKPSSACWGNAKEMRKCADDLDVIESGILKVYEDRLLTDSGYDLQSAVDAETWIKAEEASEIFKNITLVEENKAVAKLPAGMFKTFKNVPKAVIKREEPVPDDKAKEEAEKLKLELELLTY